MPSSKSFRTVIDGTCSVTTASRNCLLGSVSFEMCSWRPFHDGTALPIRYGRWGLKFGISVLWRILFAVVEEHPEAVNPAVASDIQKCLRQWKSFLRDEARSPRQFEVHLVPIVFDRSSHNSEQYLHGTIEWETIFHPPTNEAYLIIKIGRLLL